MPIVLLGQTEGQSGFAQSIIVTLPEEGEYTDVEREFIDLSPPGLWPENQDSNFGQFRKVATDIIQSQVDDIGRFARETFVATSEDYLSLWEEMLGIPVSEQESITDRRAALGSRRTRGPFERAVRNSIVERYVAAAVGGQPAAFGPTGIPFGAGGIPLYSGILADPKTLYRVYENFPDDFVTHVYIKNTVSVDVSGLTRELLRVFPAGQNFEIFTFLSNPLDLDAQMKTYGPSGWWRLGNPNAQDHSGLFIHGTMEGFPSGQIDLPQNSGDGSMHFDGVNDYVTIPDHVALNPQQFSMSAWFRTDILPAAGTYRYLFVSGDCYLAMANLSGTGVKVTAKVGDGAGDWVDIYGTTEIQTGAITHHAVCTYDGVKLRLYVNGVEELSTGFSVPLVPLGEFGQPPSLAGTKYIGTDAAAAVFWDGIIDEVAFFGYPLSPEQVKIIYNTGKNIP